MELKLQLSQQSKDKQFLAATRKRNEENVVNNISVDGVENNFEFNELATVQF
jgi:hypothetical protein